MYFKRKVYEQLLNWKEKYADRYAVLLEGARRVGKSTIVTQFAKNEYESYLMIDFATASKTITECFDDIDNMDMFFLRLQAACKVNLIEKKSVIVFDEVELFPRARQAVKYLVKDGRYHYIETGSLISIKKNVKDILIPSEEMKISIYPMDYEEFLWASNSDMYHVLEKLYQSGQPVGQELNRKLMRDFRVYMAVGGMPQAVDAYLKGDNFVEIDRIKRGIIALYEDDFKKIDSSGRISMLYRSIPSQLSRGYKRYLISDATGGRKKDGDDELLYDLIDSKTVLISYNTTDPRVSLSSTRDLNSYKLYAADTGLFLTMMFIDRPAIENELYAKMLSNKLPANLGYLYENAVAQTIASTDRELYYHTWEKENSTHYYEIDFLISDGAKLSAVEVKASGVGKHESLNLFKKKYSQNLSHAYIFSQKDLGKKDGNRNIPFYLVSQLL